MSIHLASEGWRIVNRPTNAQLSQFGLVRLEANIFCSIPLALGKIVLESKGGVFEAPIQDVGVDRNNGTWTVGVFLNTHLLENGDVFISSKVNLGDDGIFDLPVIDFKVDNTGRLASAVRKTLQAAGTPVFFAEPVDSGIFPSPFDHGAPWFNSETAKADTADVPLSLEPAVDAEAARSHMVRWGFAILPDVLPDDIIDAFNKAAAAAVADGRLPWRQGSSDRIHNAHRLPEGRAIWLYPPVLDFLRNWFLDEPCACQTLYYINGSEQSAHQDTIHLTPFPAGYMCGVWVPLEDVRPNSGELFVYPGSHRTERLMSGNLNLAKVKDDYSSFVVFDNAIRRLLEEGGYQRTIYRPKRGQILVWHENLIHGGGVRIDPTISRLSIVSHYFARGSIAYYDSRGEAASLETLPS